MDNDITYGIARVKLQEHKYWNETEKSIDKFDKLHVEETPCLASNFISILEIFSTFSLAWAYWFFPYILYSSSHGKWSDENKVWEQQRRLSSQSFYVSQDEFDVTYMSSIRTICCREFDMSLNK